MGSYKSPNGGEFRSYAPGNGAIHFVHVDHNGKATGLATPPHVAEAIKPEGWLLTSHNGQLEAYAPVRRLNDLLEFEGRLYRYRVDYEGNGWRRHAFYNAETGQELKNISMRGSLEWFLDNEKRLGDA